MVAAKAVISICILYHVSYDSYIFPPESHPAKSTLDATVY